MTALRLISLPTHAVLELAAGLAVMAAPFVFGFGPAGLVIAVLLGAVIAGLALSATPTEGRTVGVSAHFAYDRGIALGLLGAALVLGLTGDRAAAAVMAAAALVQVTLSLTTRYTARS
jgi:hypothetical protein